MAILVFKISEIKMFELFGGSISHAMSGALCSHHVSTFGSTLNPYECFSIDTKSGENNIDEIFRLPTIMRLIHGLPLRCKINFMSWRSSVGRYTS